MWKILTDVKDVNIWQNWSISTVRRAVTVCSSATAHSPAVKSYSVHVAASPWCQLPTKPVPGLLSSSVSVCPARRAATIEQISISSFALLPFAVRNGKAQTSFPRLVRCPEATPAPFVFLWALEQRPKRPEAGSAADVGFSRAQPGGFMSSTAVILQGPGICTLRSVFFSSTRCVRRYGLLLVSSASAATAGL